MDQRTEGEQVSDTTVPAPAEETVEAAKVETVAASRPAFYTAPRLEFTKAKYLENSVRAALGDDQAKAYVRAADDTTVNNVGLVPTRQLTEVVNNLSNADRPSIAAISSGVLPDAGMSFEIPRLKTAPTVAEEAEAAAIDETGMETEFITVSVKKYAGGQTFSVELLDRSSPVFFDELVRQMEFAYAKATDTAVAAALVAAATDGGNRTMTAANFLDFLSDAAVDIYKNTLRFPTGVIATPDQWGAIINLNNSGVPLYLSTINPSNASGSLVLGNNGGTVNGLPLYVDNNLGSGTGDGTLLSVDRESFRWYESARTRLQTNVALNGQIEVAYYGYGAIATLAAKGAYKWMVA